MKTTNKIIEEFENNFPTKEQVIKQRESWNFTDYFDEKLDQTLVQQREEFIKLLKGLKWKEIEKDRRPINVEIPEDMYVDGYNQKVQKQNEKINEAIKNLK